jgi:uncharacterized protein YndB with AHSA1/START domain
MASFLPGFSMSSGAPAPKPRRLAVSVTIAAPPERIFPFLDDPARMKLWMARLEAVVFDKPGIPRGAGTRFSARMRWGGGTRTFAGEVTAYRPPREADIRLAMPGLFSLDLNHRLAPAEGGTQVEQSATLTASRWPARLVAGIAARMLRRQMAQGLARLKAVVEAPPEASPGD